MEVVLPCSGLTRSCADILNEVDGPMLRHGLQRAHGNSIHVPRSADKQPDRDGLERRCEEFRAAGWDGGGRRSRVTGDTEFITRCRYGVWIERFCWRQVFRKGYVAFQRAGGRNVFVVDVYWRKAPRLALKMPDRIDRSGFDNPLTHLEPDWSAGSKEQGWRIPSTDAVPDLAPLVDLAELVTNG